MFLFASIVACLRHSTSEESGSHPLPSVFVPIKTSRTASIAMRLATSQASAPPMPSETTRTRPCSPSANSRMSSGFSAPSDPLHARAALRSSSRKLSSLPRRTRPTSVLARSSTSISYRIVDCDRLSVSRLIISKLVDPVQSSSFSWLCIFSRKD